MESGDVSQEAAGKDNQVLLQKQREALEREVQVQAAKGELAQKVSRLPSHIKRTSDDATGFVTY